MWKEKMALCVVFAGEKVGTIFIPSRRDSGSIFHNAYTGRWKKFHLHEAILGMYSNTDTWCILKATHYHSDFYSRELARPQASITNGGPVKYIMICPQNGLLCSHKARTRCLSLQQVMDEPKEQSVNVCARHGEGDGQAVI